MGQKGVPTILFLRVCLNFRRYAFVKRHIKQSCTTGKRQGAQKQDNDVQKFHLPNMNEGLTTRVTASGQRDNGPGNLQAHELRRQLHGADTERGAECI